MEECERKLLENAQKIVEFGQEHAYLDNAFYYVFGQHLMKEGYVDGSYILEVYGRGTYYTQSKNSSLSGISQERKEAILSALQSGNCNFGGTICQRYFYA